MLELFGEDIVVVMLLVGFGCIGNVFNDILLVLFVSVCEWVVLFMLYFNLLWLVCVVIGQLLWCGCMVEIMVGDKVVNDFYILLGQLFCIIGVLFYFYESNLCCFVCVYCKYLVSGQLVLYLWKYVDNSYYFKGLFIDYDVVVFIGNNFNLCVWVLDLENVLVLCDLYGYLCVQYVVEWVVFKCYVKCLCDYYVLDIVCDYFVFVCKLLCCFKGVCFDCLVNCLLQVIGQVLFLVLMWY